MSLFAELRRRNVFRIAIAYLAVAWLILQVADVILGNFDAPRSVFRFLVAFLALGLPFAVFFAWVFELTPDGIKRESDVDRSVSITNRTGRKLDMMIIAVLSVAVVFLLVDKFMGQSATESITSVAVLPFANRSAIADDIHFVDGIHDDILTLLANMSGLDKVISRTSVERYRDTNMSIQDIGNELDVSAILEGGVQRAGDRVRINMQLIDAATDQHLWAETYEREVTVESLFTVQGEISREVAAALHIALTKEDEERLDRMPTDSLEAYNAYVLGRQEMALRTGDALERALSHFERAVEIDPDYALAHVGIADVLGLQPEYAGVDPVPLFGRRQEAIDTALRLDPSSGEAYAALGMLLQRKSRVARGGGRRDEADELLAAAETAFLTSIELSPNYASSYHWYSTLLNTDERREESLQYVRRALELDPAASVLTGNLVNRLHLLGRMEEARQALLDGLARNPLHAAHYESMALILKTQAQIGEAAAWMDRAAQLNSTNFRIRWQACWAQIELDDPEAAGACVERLWEDFPEGSMLGLHYLDATVLIVSNQPQAAVDQAESRAAEVDDPALDQVLAVVQWLNGEFDKARPFYEERFPRYFSDEEIVLTPSEVAGAVVAAVSMQNDEGFPARAQYLAGRAIETMQSMHRTRGIAIGDSDVWAFMILGNHEQAAAALRDAIDSGWRDNWWRLRTPAFRAATHAPEFTEMIAELEADIAEQRRWYQENKGEPLF